MTNCYREDLKYKKREKTLAKSVNIIYNSMQIFYATVAQLAEQRIRNAQVVGSNPTSSSKNPECDSVQDFYLLPITSSLFTKIAFRIFGKVRSNS